MDYQDYKVTEQSFRDCIKIWMPNLQTASYFMPDIPMNRVPCQMYTFADQHVLVRTEPEGANTTAPLQEPPAKKKRSKRHKGREGISVLLKSSDDVPENHQPDQSTTMWSTLPNVTDPEPVQDCYIRDDKAQKHVLYCLKGWAGAHPHEVMVVLSQLRYGDYLGKPCYAQAVRHCPRPVDLDRKMRRGDFDVLIIHQRLGLVVLEIKSIGINAGELDLCEKDQIEDIHKKVKKGISQLDKAEKLLLYLVKDILPEMLIRKSLVLPYVTTSQLRQAVMLHEETSKELCKCLEAENVDQATDLCLCSDNLPALSPAWNVSDDVVHKIQSWWERLTAMSPSSSDVDKQYEPLVARFCGPATLVSVHCIAPPRMELRTKGEAVAEAGHRMALLSLYPEQMELLNEGLPQVFLTGPPGTGKSIVLVLMGLQWLRDGHDVHVVSTWNTSLASCIMIQHQLNRTMEEAWRTNPESTGSSEKIGRVHYHEFDFQQSENVERAVEKLRMEAKGGKLYILADEVGPDTSSGSIRFKTFYNELLKCIPSLHLWSASMHHQGRPEGMIEKKLTTSLRCPPIVVEEVKKASELEEWGSVYEYSETPIPAPCDGPEVVHMYHEGDGHDPVDKQPCARECRQCGLDLAKYLRSLHVGQTGPSTASTPTPLQYRDVLILFWTDKLKDTGLVKGLEEAGMPVQVLDLNHNVKDVALATTDRVTVAHHSSVRGLERKIVVYVGSTGWPVNVSDRLHAMSRATSLLIWLCRRSDPAS